MNKVFLLCVLFLAVFHDGEAAPIWKVFCSGGPVYRGRVDPIVNPGKVSGHSHKVAGGNHFSAAGVNQTPLDVFKDMYSSPCTTCSIGKVDLSAYWHPDLYYTWPNGTFSVVPDGGLTIYYLSRTGSGAQAHPDWQPIPKGLRMLAGDPLRRNFTGSLEDRAVNYACLVENGADYPSSEPNNFPTDKYFCKNGLRAQVFFPMCWNGKDLDSADHKSHMAYPDGVNGGNCPDTHPVRIPGVFFEAFYSVDKFPHGTGTNPFVWANGDPTGYGFHGDFLSGWDPEIMAAALKHPKCDLNNTEIAFGNNVKACPPLAPFVQNVPAAGVCSLATDIPLTEDLGVYSAISKLPGCNPITYGPERATMCAQDPKDYTKQPLTKRFLLKSKATGKYVVAPANQDFPLNANATVLSYYTVWAPISFQYGFALQNEGTTRYVSASGPDRSQLFANRGNFDSYEGFYMEFVNGSSTVVAFKSQRTSKYVTIVNTFLYPNATAPTTDNELFILEVPDGGNVGVLGTDNPVFPPSNTTAGYEGPVTTGSGASSTTSSSSSPSGSDEEPTAGTSAVVAAFSVLVACLFAVIA